MILSRSMHVFDEAPAPPTTTTGYNVPMHYGTVHRNPSHAPLAACTDTSTPASESQNLMTSLSKMHAARAPQSSPLRKSRSTSHNHRARVLHDWLARRQDFGFGGASLERRAMNLRASFERVKEAVRRSGRRLTNDTLIDKQQHEHGEHQRSTTLKMKGYIEMKRLGKGSFGYATLVVREDSKEQFCAKFVKYKHMAPKEKEYVAREVNTMSHLSMEGGHPYLVRFRESFVLASGPLVIIMDFCDGGDLAQLISSARRKRTTFSEQQVHLWLLQLLAATDFLHTRQVLHRDIKPANVFMHAGVCKLGDLGLSKQVMMAATQAGAHTQCGSPLYLAPEVHMGMKYSKKIDVWAIGCTLYEMMMLEHAFQGPDNEHILQNIVRCACVPVRCVARDARLRAPSTPPCCRMLNGARHPPCLHGRYGHGTPTSASSGASRSPQSSSGRFGSRPMIGRRRATSSKIRR